MPTSTKVEAIKTRLSGLLGRGAATAEASPTGLESFFVVKQADGRTRWVAFSSNSFIDREKEIVSHDALADAVGFADRTGRRGPLRLFHVAKADVGTCDFQAIEGRFLIESGTFDPTPAGRSAEKYFLGCKERMGISIGFAYRADTFDGRVYRQARIFERSVAPWSRVANPYTGFTLNGAQEMDKAKQDWLAEVLGPELSGRIIEGAEKATGELEALVSFKAEQDSSKEGEAAKAKMPMDGGDGDAEDATDNGADEDTEDANGKKKSIDMDAFKQFADIISEPLATIVKSIGMLSEQVKALAEGQSQLVEKMAEKAETKSAAPKAAAFRATESETTKLDAEATKKVLGDSTTQVVNPARGYLDDLLGARRA